MTGGSGWISIKKGDLYHTLHFASHGWLAVDLVQYLDEIYQSPDPKLAILKLLGYTMQVGKARPRRKAEHWVEIDLDRRVLITNSNLLRQAVDQTPAPPQDPYNPHALRRIYQVLDRYDFTVKFR